MGRAGPRPDCPLVAVDDLDESRLRRLLEAGRSLVAQLDVDTVLDELLEVARELTGARYAALGVLDADRSHLERFVTLGIDDETHRAIGELPRGRGILGALIDEPRPLRLERIGDDPRSFGLPAEHPAMETFLGVPIVLRGEAWGNLYLTEKAGGEVFTDADEHSVVVLADWAAVAIDNARLYASEETRRIALERAMLGLEATTAIARAVGGETELKRILELIVKRGRALVNARSLTIVLRQGEGLAIAARAGELTPTGVGAAPEGPSLFEDVMRSQRPERLASDVPAQLDAWVGHVGADHPQTALLVPLMFRGQALGVLCAFDHLGAEPAFADEHERLLLAFAASAATAVATAQSFAHARVRHSVRAAEEERRRWARELHDETLQAMAGLRVILASALRRRDPATMETSVREAVEHLGKEIENLRALIADLRPAALDELGLTPALRSLAVRVSSTAGLDVETDLALDGPDGGVIERLEPEIETVIYRLVQEALTNAAKHSGARSVLVRAKEAEGSLRVEVSDDGRGFDRSARSDGFGLIGIQERVELVDGTISVDTSPAGTTVRAWIPARRRSGDVDASARH